MQKMPSIYKYEVYNHLSLYQFGIVDGDGYLSFWQTNPIALGATPKPYLVS